MNGRLKSFYKTVLNLKPNKNKSMFAFDILFLT